MTINKNQEQNTPPPSGHLVHPKYRPDIDGLRAVAVLSVVVYHAFPSLLKGGFVGVDIFFVISGFLISIIIFSGLERDSFSFYDFYSRRIRRIFPALLVVLISCYAFGWFALLADEYKQLGKHIATGAGFVSNLILWSESGYFDTAAETKPLLHLWSLGIEEQFYIVWPVLLWAAWKKKFNFFTISLALFFVSFGLNLSKYRVDGVADFYSPQTRFWELLAGSLLAYITRRNFQALGRIRIKLDSWLGKVVYAHPPEVKGQTLRDAQSLFGVQFIALGLVLITKEKHFPGTWAILPVLGAVCIIAAGSNSWFNRTFLSNRIVVWFGIISFPLYLWHWPLLSFARIIEGEVPARSIRITAVLLSIALAWLTYKLVEHPLRFGKRTKTITLSLLFLMIIAGSIGYGVFINDGLKTRDVVKRNFDPDSAIKYASNPVSSCVIPGLSEYVVCDMYKAEQAKGTILLWGDSTAGVWLPVFLDVAKARNLNVIRIEHQSCPPLLGVRKTRFDLPASRFYCNFETKNKILDFIRGAQPESIFVLSAWNSYSPYSNREFITDENTGDADALTTKKAIERQVPITLEKLSKIGRVVVFKAWPFLSAHPIYELNRIPFIKQNKEPVRASFSEFKKDSELINNVFEKISSRVEYFDPAAMVCDKVYCNSIYKKTKLYNDGYHISTAGALQFRSEISELVSPKN